MSHDTKHDDRIRDLAYSRFRHFDTFELKRRQLFLSAVRFQSLYATNTAEAEGREYTPIFWYVVDNDQIIMTLWDIT